MKGFLVATVIVLSFSLYGVGHGWQWPFLATVHRTETLTVSHLPAMPVRVITRNGDVTIRRSSSPEVRIRANYSATSTRRADRMRTSTTRRDDGTLEIQAQWAGGSRYSNEGCDFVIEMPDAMGVTIETTNGDITIQEMAGPISVETTNGDVTVLGATARFNIETTNSDVNVTVAPGFPDEVSVRTTNGDIEMDAALRPKVKGTGASKIRTTNSDVTVHAAR